MAFERVIQSAAENLYGDERLRSNMTDTEAQIILDWALARVSAVANAAKEEASARKAVQAELPRVRKIVVALDDLAKNSGALYSKQAAAKLQALVEPNRLLTRTELAKLLSTLSAAQGKVKKGH